ncbi:unnamed protein product [Cuscuta europaea]|uniref:Methyltransferase n=1 Tax=Cuscuta europaea TaxID=41803 RepID=A0A9P0ZVJ8_CUSEU|nr:unnamed protein product [Cuscuta europaea]
MIGLGSDHELPQAGVQTVLDVGFGFGSFGAHLLSLNLMSLCVAAYESSGSQVQLALERGLPAIIGNFISKQLPFPALAYDMVHCAQCSILWDIKGVQRSRVIHRSRNQRDTRALSVIFLRSYGYLI